MEVRRVLSNEYMSRAKNTFLKLKNLIPQYAIIPIVSMLALNGIVYFGTRLFTDSFKHYDLSGFLEEKKYLLK